MVSSCVFSLLVFLCVILSMGLINYLAAEVDLTTIAPLDRMAIHNMVHHDVYLASYPDLPAQPANIIRELFFIHQFLVDKE